MTTTTTVASNAVVSELDPVSNRGWNFAGITLRQTDDFGATWTTLHTFPEGHAIEGTTYLGDGELLVSTVDGSFVRHVWRTAGLASGTVTVTEVLTGRAPGIKFPTAWAVSTFGNIVALAEYGPKEGEPWPGVTGDVQAGEGARYVYLSLDYGATWANVFDLNAYLTGVQARADVNGMHLHGAAWDPYWGRLWVTFGDSSDGVVYSDDHGQTWRTAHYDSAPSTATQVVSVMPLPGAVLFGCDTGVGGVLRIDRAHGQWKDAYPLDVAYDPGESGAYLAQAAHRNGPGEPAIFGFGAEGAPNPSYAVVTDDGFTFTELWRDTVDQAAGFGIRSVVGPTRRGDVLIGVNDQKVSGSWSQVSVPYRAGNLTPNPSAEVTLSDWTAGSGMTLARVAGPAAHGSHYVRGTIATTTQAFNSRIVQNAPLVSGDAGKWLGWALSLRAATFDGRYRQVVTFFTAGGTQISQHLASTAPMPTVALDADAARVAYSVQVPADAARAELRVLFYNPSLGDPGPGEVHTDAWTAVTAGSSADAMAAARTFYAAKTDGPTVGAWAATPGWSLGPTRRRVRVRGVMLDGVEVPATVVGVSMAGGAA